MGILKTYNNIWEDGDLDRIIKEYNFWLKTNGNNDNQTLHPYVRIYENKIISSAREFYEIEAKLFNLNSDADKSGEIIMRNDITLFPNSTHTHFIDSNSDNLVIANIKSENKLSVTIDSDNYEIGTNEAIVFTNMNNKSVTFKTNDDKNIIFSFSCYKVKKSTSLI